jgi:hypothetical protein
MEEGCAGAVFPTTLPKIQLFREIQSPTFSQRAISSNPAFIQRMELQRNLEGHDGCVNALSFTPDGHHLLSGSDDHLIKLWNWQQGKEIFSWHSGHWSNVFQAKPIPKIQTNSQNSSPAADLTVVSSGADGQIRLAHIFEGRVAHRRVGSHSGSAHKIALIPDNTPWTFLSCGEDGKVNHYDLRLPTPSSPLMSVCHARMKFRDLELYSVACNPLHPTEFCIGGRDEAIRVFDLRKTATRAAGEGATATSTPRALPLAFISPGRIVDRSNRFDAHVTSAVYSCKGEILASYNDENIYLIAAGVASGVVKNQFSRGGNGEDGVLSYDHYPPPSSSSSSSTPRGSARGNTRANRSRRGTSREVPPPESGTGRGRGGRGNRRFGRGRPGADRGGRRRTQQQQRNQAELDSRWRSGNQQRVVAQQNTREVEVDTTLLMRSFKFNDSYHLKADQDAATTATATPFDAAPMPDSSDKDEDILPEDSILARLYAEKGGDDFNEDGNLDLDSSSDDGGGGGGGGTDDDDDENDDNDDYSLDSDYSGESFNSDKMRQLLTVLAESSEEEEEDGEGGAGGGRSHKDEYRSRWPLPELSHWNEEEGPSTYLTTHLEGVSNKLQGGVLQMYQGRQENNEKF